MTVTIMEEPLVRQLVEAAEGRGSVSEAELIALATEAELEGDDLDSLREELESNGVRIESDADTRDEPEAEPESVTMDSLDLFLRRPGVTAFSPRVRRSSSQSGSRPATSRRSAR